MDPATRPCVFDAVREKTESHCLTLPPTTLEQEKQYSLFEATAMNASGSNQCESEPYTMIRSGEELSPSSSQYGIASDAEPTQTRYIF